MIPHPRAIAVACCLLLASCGGAAPPLDFPPLTYGYLNKLRLDVANIEIDDNWQPSPDARHVEALDPDPPLTVLRQMAQDRLVAAGNNGTARFIIEDASLIRDNDQYQGSFSVRLTLTGGDGTSRGSVEARVVGTHAVTDTDPEDVRADLYDLTKRLMSSMNVELEYQVDRSMRGVLQPATPAAPVPGPVQSETLAPPS
jgi:hypothetical protein